MTDNVSIVIPCYNESSTIGELVEKILAINARWEIIIIDDGSTDGTSEVLYKYPVKIIRNQYNIGNGSSVKKGIKEAGREFVVLMDGDGQHDPADIPRLIEHLDLNDMVVGARVNFKALSRVRNIGNYFMIKLAKYLTKQKIGDLTSGFRAFRRVAALPYLPLFPARFSYPTTLTMCMIKSSMSIKYIDLPSIKRRVKGKSSLNPLIDGIRFINIMIKIVMLYSPQTIFLPIGMSGLAVSVALTIYRLIVSHKFTPNIGIFYLASLFIILLGLIAEQISNLRFEIIEVSREKPQHKGVADQIRISSD